MSGRPWNSICCYIDAFQKAQFTKFACLEMVFAILPDFAVKKRWALTVEYMRGICERGFLTFVCTKLKWEI